MEVLRFTLSGKNAFFKKPDVNAYYYFTYGNIHKVALLGIFGAILGYGGYTQMQNFDKRKKRTEVTEGYPEFYERLKDIKISIVPDKLYEKSVIPRKVQTFNNSVGYASKEQGGNLIVKEQWLELPAWEICLLIDSEEAQKIKESVIGHKCVYYPYLGKNDHPADISNIRIEQLGSSAERMGQLNCLVPKEKVRTVDLDDDDREEMGIPYSKFKYTEALPYQIDSWINNYILETFVYTDDYLEVTDTAVYCLEDGKRIVFY